MKLTVVYVVTRAVSAALQTPPNRGGSTLSQGAKIQSRHHLRPERKLWPPKLEYEALEISEIGGPLKEKCLYITLI